MAKRTFFRKKLWYCHWKGMPKKYGIGYVDARTKKGAIRACIKARPYLRRHIDKIDARRV